MFINFKTMIGRGKIVHIVFFWSEDTEYPCSGSVTEEESLNSMNDIFMFSAL